MLPLSGHPHRFAAHFSALCSAFVRTAAPYTAAPLTAALLLSALVILDERGFNSGSAMLLALCAALAAASLVPVPAVVLVLLALALQVTGLFPPVTVAGVLPYAAVPLMLFFAARAWPGSRQGVLAGAAVVAAALTTASWFNDSFWINFMFGTQVNGRGVLRSMISAFLILGAFTAVNLAGHALGRALNAASTSRRAQLKAEEQLRETATELALEQERNRIAVELHDVLAHSLAVIMSQADGLRYIHRSEPELVEDSAAVIASSARTALLETRRLVEGFSGGSADTPAAGLQDLPALVERMRSSGLPVRLASWGTPEQLTPAQELVVYRLVQESLTNAFKHGARQPGVDVSQEWTGTGLRLQVTSTLLPGNQPSKKGCPTGDKGPGADDDGGSGPDVDGQAQPNGQAQPSGSLSGHGLPGMRARAAAAGGWAAAGAAAGSFVVTAFLPGPAGVSSGAGPCEVPAAQLPTPTNARSLQGFSS